LATILPAPSSANAAAQPSPAKLGDMQWLDLPHPRLEMRGLPWLAENAPELYRLPKRAQAEVPKAVWNRGLAPDGARIRLSCNTTRLAIRAQVARPGGKRCFFDAFVNGEYAGSVPAAGTNKVDLVFFEKKDRAWKDITIYLPHRNDVRVFAVGLDADAEFKTPPPFALKRPIVCYGSSVLQGTGAAHPSRTYPAAVARRLNLDFVNLGFGGAGKAEMEVVALVNQLDACCYLFDLGKSYGAAEPERYNRMLDTIRAAHPTVPIFCVTPIYSTKEENEPAYKKRSEDLRTLMRQAATDRRQAGDKLMFVVEGLDLFGARDKQLLADPAHPNDDGNALMAERLAPLIEKVVLGADQRAQSNPPSGTNAIPLSAP
jgi:lysophospholipase L1-like esterase